MADNATTTDVTPEAYQRVQAQRDEARGQVEDIGGKLKAAESALAGYQLRDRAYDHFAGKDEGDRPRDPFAVARMAVNDTTLRNLDDEALPGALDDWYVKVVSLAPAAPATEEPTAEPPPVPRAAGPSPAGDGSAHTAEPLDYANWRQKNPTAGFDEYKAARQSGAVAAPAR